MNKKNNGDKFTYVHILIVSFLNLGIKLIM